MELNAPFEAAPVVKVMINIGALMDIPTGTYLEGVLGEYIMNAGLGFLTGVVGIGNNFKSTLLHFQMLTAMVRMGLKSTKNTYDTEVNIHEWHLVKMIERIFADNMSIASLIDENLSTMVENVLETGRWVITDKTMHVGNEWYEILKTWLENKRKNSSKISVATPFWNRGRKGNLMILQPTFSEMDSLTEFETDDVIDMQDENELGESGGNTIHMRQGLAKLRLLMEAPRLHGGSYNYFGMTAHLGKESTMQKGGGGRDVPIVKLKHLKNGDKIKGTTDKFTFVTNNCWHAYDAKPLINDGTKGPEYPRNADDNLKLDNDLNEVKVKQLRSKSGPTGVTLTILVSQQEGVLSSLTEFHHLRETKRYGMVAKNGSNYNLDLLPDLNLQRTTVRGKIDTMPRLRRALNITSEMCQMDYLWHHLGEDLVCDPKDLYADLAAMGYNWDVLLDTRGWWTIDNDKHPVPFLSTMDLLRMRVSLYHPYWYDAKLKELGLPAFERKELPHVEMICPLDSKVMKVPSKQSLTAKSVAA